MTCGYCLKDKSTTTEALRKARVKQQDGLDKPHARMNFCVTCVFEIPGGVALTKEISLSEGAALFRPTFEYNI